MPEPQGRIKLQELCGRIAKAYEKRLSKKTGWGRNEAYKELLEAMLDVVGRLDVELLSSAGSSGPDPIGPS